jgi:2-phosphosulfolactate phosphatase
MISKPKVEVCYTPNLFPLYTDGFDVVVAIDVLRATSVICTAFQYGVEKIIPVSSVDEANDYLKKGYQVAAERKGEIVNGFKLGNSPLTYMNNNLKGETLVLTTTNGTRAINTAKESQQLFIGSFLNLDALCNHLIYLKKNVLLLGSGWQNKFCLEDSICAGAICDQLLNTNKFESNNDSTIAARYLYLSAKTNYFGFLKASSHRKRLKKLNLNEDIKYCLTPNQTDVIPYKENNYLKILT